jgi:hypothetical protein
MFKFYFLVMRFHILLYHILQCNLGLVGFMLFNATFNNISALPWRSVLLVEETRVPGENHWQTLSHNVVHLALSRIQTHNISDHRHRLQVTDKLYHIMLYTSPWAGFELTTSVIIGTDCIGSCKSNYHTITATTAPF